MTGDFPCGVCGNYYCGGHLPMPTYPAVIPTPWGTTTTTTLKWPPDPSRLHPDDIEKIAKRVVELLKGTDASTP